MATAGGFVRGEFEAAEVAQDIADREAQLRGSMAKSAASNRGSSCPFN